MVFQHGVFGLGTEFIESRLEAGGPAVGRPCAIEDFCGEALLVEVFDALEFVFIQDRAVEAHRVAVQRGFREEVPLRSEAGAERHDRPFADRVDGRIGDLREQLLEISEKQPRVCGKHGERDVVAHGKYGFLGALDHWREDHVEFLLGNAVGHLLAREVERREVDLRDVGSGGDELAEFEAVFVDPAAVRFLARELLLDFAIVFEFSVGGVGGNHLTGAESALADHFGIFDDHRSGFRSDVEDAVLGDLVAGGTQTIAVQ